MESPSTPDPADTPNPHQWENAGDTTALVPAFFGVRIVAFCMDYILIIAATFMISTQILYPYFHPGFIEASQAFIEEQQTAEDIGFQEQMQQYVEFQMAHEQVANDTGFIAAVLTWIYFAMSELLLGGTTLGKKIFKLSLIDLKTLNRPEGKTILLRNCLKSLSVIVTPLFIVNLVFVIFNRLRLAGHDMACKTMVTYDYALPPIKSDFPQNRSTE